jgi:hypothetical protein
MLEARVVLINMINILFLRVFLLQGKYFYKLTTTLSAHSADAITMPRRCTQIWRFNLLIVCKAFLRNSPFWNMERKRSSVILKHLRIIYKLLQICEYSFYTLFENNLLKEIKYYLQTVNNYLWCND